MKRCMSIILVFLLFLSCIISEQTEVFAAEKSTESRAIAIVFDNSGSMYYDGNMAWCRATYAMEVFASMLNEGDTLLIYPMHPITVGDDEYTMQDPFKLTDANQASKIREIYTENAIATPIESVDYAAEGLSSIRADKKYLIVLSDGDSFFKNGSEMSATETKNQLDSRFQAQTESGVTAMYLGIGSNAVMPTMAESDLFVKRQAESSSDVLSALTEMCNLVFGRDTLPESCLSGKTMSIDVSMNKLIVFVQGDNVSDLQLIGQTGTVGRQVSSTSTKYGTAGTSTYTPVPDTTLQGMMVTYADCSAGTYTISYSGTATSVEVYYEPNVDLDFVFTDAQGNTVDLNSLYEGEYKVSFGMKDASTGALSSSALLGEPHYEGSYYINGEEHAIEHDGYSGEVPVSLSMGDTFKADLTVTYLSGYTITKDASDFGWPADGVEVAARPAGELSMEITGGDDSYSLEFLEDGAPYIATVYYQGTKLTGEDLENVSLQWDPNTSNAEITQTFADDHYELRLSYKDPSAPEQTVCGDCTVDIYAFYSEKGSTEAQTKTPLTYTIEDESSALRLNLKAADSYVVIGDLEKSEPITATITLNGEPLTQEEFATLELQLDNSDLNYEVTADELNSSYSIRIVKDEKATEGEHIVKATAVYTDNIGRTMQASDTVKVRMGHLPIWLRWTIGLGILLLLLLIIWLILHIRVLPRKAYVTKRNGNSSMIFEGEDVTQNTTFSTDIYKGGMKLTSKYAGVQTGIQMSVKPGKESYLMKKQKRRSADVEPSSVRKIGGGTIQELTIGNDRYVLNEETNKLERTPKSEKKIGLTNGKRISYSGTMMLNGEPKPFNVTTKLQFGKK